MPHKKRPYKEGSWFAIPLKEGGYALGLIARQKKALILGYFFGPRYPTVPTLNDAVGLGHADAMQRMIFGDLELLNGLWPVLGELPDWERSKWPMPNFSHKDSLSDQMYLRIYDENTLEDIGERRISADEARNLPEDGTFGAGAVRIVLSRLIHEAEQQAGQIVIGINNTSSVS